MQEKDAVVALYDNQGNIIGRKFRRDVDKKSDILKAAHVLVFNGNDEIFLVQTKDDLWPDKWGGSCAGFVREGEEPMDTALRTLKRELGLNIDLDYCGQKYYEFDGVKGWIAVFVAESINNPKINLNDFVMGRWFSIEDARKLIKEKKVKPTFEVAMLLRDKPMLD